MGNRTFNSFPVAVALHFCTFHQVALVPFNSFPVAVPVRVGVRSPHRILSILSQLLWYSVAEYVVFTCVVCSFNSFPVAVYINFLRWLAENDTFNSFPVASEVAELRQKMLSVTFNSFPVASFSTDNCPPRIPCFQFFPSCIRNIFDIGSRRIDIIEGDNLSILSQLLSAYRSAALGYILDLSILSQLL
ncbi:MAG: hypothetical protein N3E41_08920 [Thermofilaceae archaeon]|nr:hypothetical protein [Thermofilaceae archaeon]